MPSGLETAADARCRESWDYAVRVADARSGRRSNLAIRDEQSGNGRAVTRHSQSGKPERKHPMPAQDRSAPPVCRPGCRRAMRPFSSLQRQPRACAYPGHHYPAKTIKAPDCRGLCCPPVTVVYFSEVLIEPNLVFSVLPMPLTTAMIAAEIPAAIRPYSMAVAPDSSFTKRAIRFFIDNSMCTRGWSNNVGLAGVLSTVTMALP